MKRGGYIARRTRLGRNRKRSAKTHARNFGDRADAVRAMPCILAGRHECRGPVQACHAKARGMGGAKGDRRDLWPGCAAAHEEAGERPGLGRWAGTKRAAFVERWGTDPELVAREVAERLDAAGYA